MKVDGGKCVCVGGGGRHKLLSPIRGGGGARKKYLVRLGAGGSEKNLMNQRKCTRSPPTPT